MECLLTDSKLNLKSNILYKCGWSPFEGHTFDYSVDKTFVNGKLVYSDGTLTGEKAGQRLLFTPRS